MMRKTGRIPNTNTLNLEGIGVDTRGGTIFGGRSPANHSAMPAVGFTDAQVATVCPAFRPW
ncbi:hypothetical protein [Marinobacter gelidimuriae]|uniref:hypothetical protein n=1 Tax=Marinobacter gelidimuriae TaxID=2739064 RepID=UPI0012DE176C|nr:hypothetical protein [Marinobacter gelidimuriae]